MAVIQKNRTNKPKSQTMEVMKRLARNKLAMLGLFVIVLMILMAVFAPLIAPYGYETQNMKAVYLSPCKEHLLGTDRLGRDILSRLIYGARQSLRIGIFSVAIGAVLGTTLGAIADFMEERQIISSCVYWIFINLSPVCCCRSHWQLLWDLVSTMRSWQSGFLPYRYTPGSYVLRS